MKTDLLRVSVLIVLECTVVDTV